MPPRLETELESKFLKRVEKELHIPSIKLNLQGNRGWPDREFLLPIRSAYIEFKKEGEEPYKLQAHRLLFLSHLTYDVIWTDDYEYAYKWLKDLLTSRLSKTGRSFDDWTSLCRSFTRSGFREDVHIIGRVKDSV